MLVKIASQQSHHWQFIRFTWFSSTIQNLIINLNVMQKKRTLHLKCTRRKRGRKMQPTNKNKRNTQTHLREKERKRQNGQLNVTIHVMCIAGHYLFDGVFLFHLIHIIFHFLLLLFSSSGVNFRCNSNFVDSWRFLSLVKIDKATPLRHWIYTHNSTAGSIFIASQINWLKLNFIENIVKNTEWKIVANKKKMKWTYVERTNGEKKTLNSI